MASVKMKADKLKYEGSEAFKALRTNLQFCGDDKKTIVFTSCAPDEGKSTVVLHLAVSLAETGKKVLLIDADMRKSVLVGHYSIAGDVFGLAHYLSGLCDLEKAVCQTDIENMDVIFAGPFPPNPTELLAGEKFKGLLQIARDTYDYVLIDSAPLGSVIDCAVIAKECDGSVIIVENEVISHRFLQEIKTQLEKSGRPILGVILNKVDIREQRYYSRYYGKKYGKYYGKYYGYGKYGNQMQGAEKTE